MWPLKELKMFCFLNWKPLEYLHNEVVSEDLSPPTSWILKENKFYLLEVDLCFNFFNDVLRTVGWMGRDYGAAVLFSVLSGTRVNSSKLWPSSSLLPPLFSVVLKMSSDTYCFRFILKVMPSQKCKTEFIVLPLNSCQSSKSHFKCQFWRAIPRSLFKHWKMIFVLSLLLSHLPKLRPFAKISKLTSVHLPLGIINYYMA